MNQTGTREGVTSSGVTGKMVAESHRLEQRRTEQVLTVRSDQIVMKQ